MLLVLSFALAVIFAVAAVDGLHWLIPVILLFVGLGIAVLVWRVLHLAEKDPTPLVLGEMTGGDWIAHRRLTLGDDLRGDRVEVPPTVEELIPPASTEASDEITIELPPAEEN